MGTKESMLCEYWDYLPYTIADEFQIDKIVFSEDNVCKTFSTYPINGAVDIIIIL